MTPRWLAARKSTAFCAAAITIALAAGTAPAQSKYTELKQVKDIPDGVAKVRALIAAGTFGSDEDARQLEAHYQFRLADMTIEATMDGIAKKRLNIKADLYNAGNAASPAVHDRLANYLLRVLPRLVGNNKLHPSARVNWALLLGDLNSTELKPGGGGVAVPLAGAFDQLVLIFNDAKQPPAIRTVALAGIIRHLELGSPSDAKKRALAVQLVAFLNLKDPPAGFDKPVFNFVRGRAIDALRLIVAKDANLPNAQAAVTALAKLCIDPNAGIGIEPNAAIGIRCKAADTLGMFDPKAIPPAAIQPTARALGELVVQISKMGQRDPVRVRALGGIAAKAPGAGGDAAKAPAAGDAAAAKAPAAAQQGADAAKAAPGVAAPAPPVAVAPAPVDERKLTLSRELQTYLVGAIRNALKGTPPAGKGLAGAATADADKKLVGDIVAKVDEMYAALTNRNLDKSELATQLESLGKSLELIIKEKEVAQAPEKGAAAPVATDDKPMQVSAPLNR